jgi:hypothetical protein
MAKLKQVGFTLINNKKDNGRLLKSSLPFIKIKNRLK